MAQGPGCPCGLRPPGASGTSARDPVCHRAAPPCRTAHPEHHGARVFAASGLPSRAGRGGLSSAVTHPGTGCRPGVRGWPNVVRVKGLRSRRGGRGGPREDIMWAHTAAGRPAATSVLGGAWWAPAPSATPTQSEAAVGHWVSLVPLRHPHTDAYTQSLGTVGQEAATCGPQPNAAAAAPAGGLPGTAWLAHVRVAHGGCPAVSRSWVAASLQTAKPNDSARPFREGVPGPGEGGVPERAARRGSGWTPMSRRRPPAVPAPGPSPPSTGWVRSSWLTGWSHTQGGCSHPAPALHLMG